ncbi:MAG: HAD-IC family P-type ATPase [Proteobacteria bacterium]|nr:HAD-IC family P-type ATPase [Pseudomonadota bacterium]
MPSVAVTTDPAVGLTSDEAAGRLARYGRNEVVEKPESLPKRLAQHFWAPVPWMLEATVVLQLVIGERIEAGLIAALLLFNVALGAFQEGRANTALALLKQHLSLRATARRDGRWSELPAALLVPGDIVQLSLAAIVPADMQIVDGSILLDQSMLTGESVAAEAGAGKTAYAGSMVRRGEAVAVVTATGRSTYFGRTAELVRIAHVESAEVKAVLGLVRNLSVLNAAIVVGLVAYAHAIALPTSQIIELVLTAMLSAVPVALPATFTLAAALGAKHLALKGVLLTRLTALHEAATIDVLCADKTGTLTQNKIGIAAVHTTCAGWTADDVLAFAALASSPDGRDPIDMAIRAAAQEAKPGQALPTLRKFTPFEPATKRAQALAQDADGHEVRIVKGAPSVMASIAPLDAAASAELETLSSAGYRTLAIAVGVPGRMALIGLIALNDPPRDDSATLLGELRALGVPTVIVTGDTAATAATVGRVIGITGSVCSSGHIPDRVTPDDFAIYAGVFPEEKFRVVKALQRGGYAVGMCGDGANDAPALRQAQMGIAVETATDVAKAAAGLVLTKPGLEGIVTAVKEGRTVFQRVLTYTIGILVNKVVTLVILGAGLLLTGQAVLTPMLQALAMFTNDFVSMARTADRATPSTRPNAWRLRNLTIATIPLAAFKFLFCLLVLATGAFHLGLSHGQIQTLVFVMFVFAGQALVFVLRERGHLWNSRPSSLMMLFSAADIVVVSTLAVLGILMTPLPLGVVLSLFGATIVFALLLDQLKVVLFHHVPVD